MTRTRADLRLIAGLAVAEPCSGDGSGCAGRGQCREHFVIDRPGRLCLDLGHPLQHRGRGSGRRGDAGLARGEQWQVCAGRRRLGFDRDGRDLFHQCRPDRSGQAERHGRGCGRGDLGRDLRRLRQHPEGRPVPKRGSGPRRRGEGQAGGQHPGLPADRLFRHLQRAARRRWPTRR